MLLIVSNKRDLATDFLVLRLIERGTPFFRLNTEDYLSSWSADFFLSGSNRVRVTPKNEAAFFVEDVSGAYIRQPQMPELNVAEDERSFAAREVGESLKSLWRFIPDCKWLNPPRKLLLASNKPEQLTIAKACGFNIPNTLISANQSEIQSFFDQSSSEIIAKAVKHGFLYEGGVARIAPTRVLTEHHIASLKRYCELPMIVQERIPKKYDIRVTVIGDKVFAIAIFSQAHSETSVDWRVGDALGIDLSHEPVTLPEEVSDRCLALTKYFGLKYSAIDLVLDEREEYFFLELNPNGQWAWVEQVAKYPIRDTIIDTLVGADSNERP